MHVRTGFTIGCGTRKEQVEFGLGGSSGEQWHPLSLSPWQAGPLSWAGGKRTCLQSGQHEPHCVLVKAPWHETVHVMNSRSPNNELPD